MLRNGLITYKRKILSFINKGITTLLLSIFLLIILPCSYVILAYWSEIPLFIKISWPIILTIVLIGVLITSLNGMVITKNGTILFVPDFRIKKLNIKDSERISFNFNEWENSKYSVRIKFVYKDARFFIKDYSKQFRNIKKKKMVMSIYTISKRKIDKILKKVEDLNFCNISIIDKNGKICYQKN